MTKPTLLVVEDSPDISGLIEHFLTTSAYFVVSVVTTGEEAVDAACRLKPDLVLMDVQLAGKVDGIEAGGLIWEQLRIPVVYLTGNYDKESIARAACSEAYGYLHKPVRECELLSAIHMALTKHESDCRVKEKEKWLETTLQCIADAVIATDSLGCVKLINPVAELLTGWTQEEGTGRDLMEVLRVVEPDTRELAENSVVELIVRGSAPDKVCPRILISRNGTEALVEERATPIVNEAGSIVGVVLVFRELAS